MASVAQIEANRLNAQKSTGPRTAEGKERASRNALKHGLLAQEAVIQGEDPAEFEGYRDRMLEELAPDGLVEAMLAERVVGLAWRLRRAERLQNAAFVALDDCEPTPLLEARHEQWKQLKGSEWDRSVAGLFDEDAALGEVVVEDFGGARVLDRLLMYERRIESSLYRTMAELRRERQARMATEREEVSRSETCPPMDREPAAPAELGSFDEEVLPEAVSSLKCEVSNGEEVSSAESPVPGDRSDFTLQTSHVRLGKITPYGVTTNMAAGGNHGLEAHATERGRDAHATGHGRDARATGTPDGVAANDERRAPQPPAETLHASRSIVRNEPNLGRSRTLGVSFPQGRESTGNGGGVLSAARS
jgi:hypothetical protein